MRPPPSSKQPRLRMARAPLFGLILAAGFLFVLRVPQAGPPPSRIETDFSSNPADAGWRVFGDASLFRWDADAGCLAVTWDSARSNSYYYLPLGTWLTRDDDFRIEFTFTLDDIAVGTTPGKPYAFQLALGLVNLAQATDPAFRRGTGMDSPNLVEWNYFPESGYGTTVAAVIVSESNAWANPSHNTSWNNPACDLQIGTSYRFVLDYRASAQRMEFEMVLGDQRFSLAPVTIPETFGDFAVDALAISSYSDAGQDPDWSGSVLAHGRIDGILLEVPPPPIRRFRGGWIEGAWRAEFTGWLGWEYTIEASSDLRAWSAIDGPSDGTGRRQALTDPHPASDRSFYRIRANSQ